MSAVQSHVGLIPVIVARGGTGATSLTDGGVLLGSGTGAITALAQATTGQVLVGASGADPAFTSTPSVATSLTAPTLLATTFDTNVAAAGVTLAGTTLSADGTDANISITINAKGSGSVVQTRGEVGGDVSIDATNTDNTNGASRAGFEAAVGGTSAGDPYVNFLISGGQTFTMGIDNSVSGDPFVISDAATLGTTNVMSISGTDHDISVYSLQQSNLKLTFQSSPLLQSNANTGAAPTGATGDVNLMQLQGGWIMNQFIIGGGQTIIAPRMTTTGLLTSLDLTNTEGAEYNFGVNPNNPFAFTIGTSPAFFIELQVNAADVGGLDPLLIGFRKQAANDGTYTNYTDVASIGARATTAADVAVISTNLNAGGFVYTNTTDAWTDGQTKTFKVLVSGAGVVTYTINGAAPTVTAAFTFDSGDVVMPFVHHVFGAATPGAINWISLAVGLQ